MRNRRYSVGRKKTVGTTVVGHLLLAALGYIADGITKNTRDRNFVIHFYDNFGEKCRLTLILFHSVS